MLGFFKGELNLSLGFKQILLHSEAIVSLKGKDYSSNKYCSDFSRKKPVNPKCLDQISLCKVEKKTWVKNQPKSFGYSWVSANRLLNNLAQRCLLIS